MSQTYFALLTAVGEAKLANAAALGTQLQISRMAVGDGNGNLPVPSRTQTALINERYRADLNELKVDPNNASQIIAELVIPETEGGYWLREMGLYDATGALIAVSNCPPSYKPQMAEGSGRTQILRMVLIVSSTAAVQLKIDPSVVLATRAFVETTVAALPGSASPLMDGEAAPGASPNVSRQDHRHPTDTSRAPLASPALTGVPTAPTAAAGTNTTQLATTAFVQQEIAGDLATAAPLMAGAAAVGVATKLAREDHRHPTDTTRAPLASPAFTGTPTAPTAAVGTNNTQLASTAFVQAAVGVGSVSTFAMSTPPAGWLKANGAAVSRSTYAALFAAIGTTFGAGDGSTTFNLPDLRGEFVRGWDDGRGLDSGRAFGSSQSQDTRLPSATVLQGTGGMLMDTTAGSNFAFSYAPQGIETRPRNIALLQCIKY